MKITLARTATATFLLSSLSLATYIAPAQAADDRSSAGTADNPPVGRTINEGETFTNTFTQTMELEPGKPQKVTFTVEEELKRDSALEKQEQQAAGAKAVKCWEHKYKIRTKSVKVLQHEWWHYVNWCFKGKKPHRLQRHQGQNKHVGTAWHWRGNSKADSYRTKKYFYAYKQGHYELCWPKVGCFQNNYPAHGARYKRGKLVTTEARVR